MKHMLSERGIGKSSQELQAVPVPGPKIALHPNSAILLYLFSKILEKIGPTDCPRATPELRAAA